MIQQKMAEIPTVQQLAGLPAHALVALAARATRRVVPRARLRDRPAIDEALGIAERFARGDLGLAEAATAAASAAGERASEAHREGHESADTGSDSAAAFHASAAATSAAYVAHAVQIAAEGHDGDIPRVVHAAIQAACYVDRRAVVATAADYLRLLDRNLGQGPEPGPIVDPGEDGPLGPLWTIDNS